MSLADLAEERRRQYEQHKAAELAAAPAPELTLSDWQATRHGIEQVDLTGEEPKLPDVAADRQDIDKAVTGEKEGRRLGGTGAGAAADIRTMHDLRDATELGDEVRRKAEQLGKGRRLEDEPEDDDEVTKVDVSVTLWKDGFQVDVCGDGTLPGGERVYGVMTQGNMLPFGAVNEYHDRRFAHFVKQVQEFKAPQELEQLLSQVPGRGHINMTIVDRANTAQESVPAPRLEMERPKPKLEFSDDAAGSLGGVALTGEQEDGREPAAAAAAAAPAAPPTGAPSLAPATGGAGRLMRQRVEKRVDPEDGNRYSKQEFMDCYEDWQERWDAAGRPPGAPPLKKPAPLPQQPPQQPPPQQPPPQQPASPQGAAQADPAAAQSADSDAPQPGRGLQLLRQSSDGDLRGINALTVDAPEPAEQQAAQEPQELETSHSVKGQRKKRIVVTRAPTALDSKDEGELERLRRKYQRPGAGDADADAAGEGDAAANGDAGGEDGGEGGQAHDEGHRLGGEMPPPSPIRRAAEPHPEQLWREQEEAEEEVAAQEREMDRLRGGTEEDELMAEVMGKELTCFPRRRALQDAADWPRMLAVVHCWNQLRGTAVGSIAHEDIAAVCAFMPLPRYYFDPRLRGDFDASTGPYQLRCSQLDRVPLKGGVCVLQPPLVPGKKSKVRFRFGGFFGRCAGGSRTHVGVLRVIHPAQNQLDHLVRTQFLTWGPGNLPHLIAADVAGGVHPKTAVMIEGGAGRKRTVGGEREGKTGLRASQHPIIDVEVDMKEMIFTVADGSGKRWSGALFRQHANASASQATFHLCVGLGSLACGEAFVDVLPAVGTVPPGRPLAWQLSRKTAVALDMDGYELPYRLKRLAPPESWGKPVRIALGKDEAGEVVALKSMPAEDIQCDFYRMTPAQREKLDYMFGFEDDVARDAFGNALDLAPDVADGEEVKAEWDCPSCQAFNFADKDLCFKCGGGRPKGVKLGGKKTAAAEGPKLKCKSCAGDWPCKNELCVIGEFLAQNPVLPHHWERHHGPIAPLGDETTGTVRKWIDEGKYGFITPDPDEDGKRRKDVFVHISSFTGSGLKEGAPVTFRIREETLSGKARAEQVTGEGVLEEELDEKGKGKGMMMKGKGKGKMGKGMPGQYGGGFGYNRPESKCDACGGEFPCKNPECYKSRPRRGPRKGKGRGTANANPEGRTLGGVQGRGGVAQVGKRIKEGGGYCCGCGTGGLLLRPSPLNVGLGPGLYCEACIAGGHRGEGPGGRGYGKGRGTVPPIGRGVGRGVR